MHSTGTPIDADQMFDQPLFDRLDQASIGEWVLIEACRVVSELQPDHDFRVAINLSSRQFSHPNHLLDCVLLALRRSGLMPNQLELEITETILIDDPALDARSLNVSLQKLKIASWT